ncbi:hypothetical protein AB0L71_10735 [Streptomyces sp. NPDC052052]|uniref:hypothetical protein n=1 Tax=Streptomyces sp. NPDC052052 TaxID=3154756 RepID=UPI00341CD9B3
MDKLVRSAAPCDGCHPTPQGPDSVAVPPPRVVARPRTAGAVTHRLAAAASGSGPADLCIGVGRTPAHALER